MGCVLTYSRPMGRTRGRSKIDQRLAQMSPPLAEPMCEVDVSTGFDDPLTRSPLTSDLDLLIRLTWDGARLVSFALMLVFSEGDQEHEVARVDTAHDEVHLHQFKRGGDEISRDAWLRITTLQDVGAGYDAAIARILDDDAYLEMHRRWSSGR